MELKKLKSIKQLINIYKLYHSSFPKEEKKPFLLILIGILKKRFEVFSIENETDGFIGLAIILKYNDLILLDFFSISSDIRSRGYGSKVLNLLKEYYNSLDKAESLLKAIKTAGNVQANLAIAFGRDPYFFGTMMRELMMNNSDVYNLYLNKIRDIERRDVVNMDKYIGIYNWIK